MAVRQLAAARLVLNFMGPGEVRIGNTGLKILKQAAQHGVGSVLKSARTLQKRLQEHLDKIDAAKAAGGFTSSMETEVNSFQRELGEINRLIKKLEDSMAKSGANANPAGSAGDVGKELK